jgi:uncharacterized protein
MRLSTHEVASIKKQVAALDTEATVYLYGSRVDDNARGGDIDLLVISSRLDARAVDTLRFNLYQAIGEQRIDIVLVKTYNETPFTEYIFDKAVKL